MLESQDANRPGQKQLCNAETFLHYVRVEIERYRRYERAFTIVLIQPPASGNPQLRLEVARAASDRALALLRTSDVVAIFDRSAFVVALLPETDAAGAQTVFDRFDAQLVGAGEGWTLKLAAFPQHAASVEHFLERFSELLRDSDAETKPSDRYGYLMQATSDVSRSWRDLGSAQ